MTTNGHRNGPSKGFHREASSKLDSDWAVVGRVAALIQDSLSPKAQREGPLVQFLEPDALMKKYPIAIGEKGDDSVESILGLCRNVIDASVKTTHPLYQNQLFQAMDPIGLAASYLIEALNTNVHSYEISPAFHVIEKEVIRCLNEYCGFDDGEGIFCPGGSLGNMYGLNLARHSLDADLKQRGLFGSQPLAVFTSDQSHYSMEKGAAFMGLGLDAVVAVPSDKDGAMIPAELEKAIEKAEKEGRRAMAVNATLGTTVLGAIDPIEAIAEICKRHGIWLHGDACYGGALLLSPKQRHQLAGIERCDSLTWNWHKLAGAPLLSTAFLTRHKGLLKAAHGFGAEYLFKRKYYDPVHDSGDHSLQCGRKGDALKVWLMLKARGADGMGTHVDEAVAAAQLFCAKLAHNDNYRLVTGKLALTLKERLVKSGKGMIAYQPMKSKGLPSFFRVTIGAQPVLTEEWMDRLMTMMVDHSRDL